MNRSLIAVLTCATALLSSAVFATPPKSPVTLALESQLSDDGIVHVQARIESLSPLTELSLELLTSPGDTAAVSIGSAQLPAGGASTLDPQRNLDRRVYRLRPQLPQQLDLAVRPTGVGNRLITVIVRAPQEGETVWGDMQEVYYRVDAGKLIDGWVLPNLVGATQAERGPDQPPKAPTPLMGRGAGPLPTASIPPAATAGQNDGTLVVSGYWYMWNEENQYIPQIERLVELVNTGNVVVASTYTDLSGFYRFPAVSNPVNFYVRVSTIVNYNRAGGVDTLRLRNQGNATYNTSTATQFGVPDGSYYMGTWNTPDGTTFEGAYWAFNTVQDTWRTLFFIEGNGSIFPGSITAEWYPGSVEPTRYVRGDRVYLDNNDPFGPDVVAHESGHNVMYNIYHGSWPFDDCPSSHAIQRASGIGCAWSEGWADFVPLIVYNDQFFEFESGNRVDLEYPFGFDPGDIVEGNVAASMWDIIDSNNESNFDFYTDPLVLLWRTIYNDYNGIFCAYWNSTRTYGVKRSRDNCLHQNQIDQCATCIEDGYEQDDTCAQATFEGPTSTYTYEHCTDEDWQYVDVQKDREYVWETTDMGYSGDTILEIWNDGCNQLLASNDDKGFGNWPRGSRVVWKAPQSTRVKVRASEYQASYGPHRSYDIALTNSCSYVGPATNLQPPDQSRVCTNYLDLSWTGTSGTSEYRVWLDGQFVCQTSGATSCQVLGVADGWHDWYVQSRNACSGPVNSATSQVFVAYGLVPSDSPQITMFEDDSITWDAVPYSVKADLIRGSVTQLLTSGGDFSSSVEECVQNDVVGEAAYYGPAPPEGEAWFFLVRPIGCALPGSYDEPDPGLVAPRDASIAAAASACP
ncbi:MAG: hypothetical protein U0V87_12420 [Acidobacteriota bacterium]